MKRILLLFVSFMGLVLLVSGCGSAKLSPDVQKSFDTKAKLYTTQNMHYNIARRGVKLVETTNYQVGMLIPVNSEVTMEDVNSKQIVFLYQGQKVILRNHIKYTGLAINEIAKRYFSPKKVNLRKFSRKERKAILSAQVVPGMSKEAVLVSLGTPPAHATPSLKMDQWKYWRNRWTTFLVHFKNNKTIK